MKKLMTEWRKFLKEGSRKPEFKVGDMVEFEIRQAGDTELSRLRGEVKKVVRHEKGWVKGYTVFFFDRYGHRLKTFPRSKLTLADEQEPLHISIPRDEPELWGNVTKALGLQESEGVAMGYKIVAYEDGKLYSLQNPDLEYKADIGTVESPSGGMYLGTTKDFVIGYYAEMTDKKDALLIYEYDPQDVILGQPHEEGEIKVTSAKLVSIEVLPGWDDE